MAILSNLLVHGSGRILNKLYVGELDVDGSASFASLSASSITASSSLTSSGTLSVTGASTLNGDVTIAAGKKLQLNNTTNIAATSVGAIPLIIGASNSTHVEYDNDELQSKTNGSTTGPLHINRHGGKVYLSTGNQIYADNGNFVSVNGEIANISGSKAIYDTVNVLDTLRAAYYQIDTIQSLGGHFYVAPTRIYSSQVTFKVTNISGTQVDATVVDPNSKTQDIGGIQWTQHSIIKVSGSVGDVIFANTTGTIKSFNPSTGTMTCTLTVPDASLFQVNTTYSGTQIKNLAVMVIQQGEVDTSGTISTWPVGIHMTGFGTNNASYIDMYYGKGRTLNQPRVRLGRLDDLGQISIADGISVTPSGWGLYADNVFLNGVIYSSLGKIGGWTIGAKSLTIGTWGTSESAMLSTGNNDEAKSIGGSADNIGTWVFTAGEKFGVTKQGTMYCSNAHVAGEITATSGTIGQFNITDSTDTDVHLYKSSIYTQKPQNAGEENIYESGLNSIGSKNSKVFYIFKKNSTTVPWTEANGNYIFYISNDGTLYSRGNIDIGGTGTIGGCTMTDGELSVDSAHITSVNANNINTGTLSADRIGTNSITASKMVLSDMNNYVTVNESYSNTAITENHPFGVTRGNTMFITLDNKCYFGKNDATNNYVALSPYTMNSFEKDDELYYSIIIRGESSGKCRFAIWFYGSENTLDYTNGSSTTAIQSSDINFTTTEAKYVGTIKITDAASKCGRFAVGLNDVTSGTKKNIYCRQASLRKKAGANLIVDGSITANKIQAESITASKMLLSDPTNYIQINESKSASVNISNHSFNSQIIDSNGNTQNTVLNNPAISNGYIQKQNETQRYIPLSGYTLNSFSDGDELFYTLTMKGDASGSNYKANLGIYFYGSGNTDNMTYKSAVSGPSMYYTTEDQEYSGTIVIPAGCHEYGCFSIAIVDGIGDGTSTTSTRKQIYVKNISLRKKSGGNLIVDGSITADKIKTGSLIVGQPKNILRGTRQLNIVAQSSTGGRWIYKNFRPVNATLNTNISNVEITDSPVSGITQGIQMTVVDNHEPGFCQDGYEMKNHIGELLTFSAWVKVNRAGVIVRLQPFSKSSPDSEAEYSIKSFTIPNANEWTFISYTIPTPIKYDHDSISIGYVILRGNASNQGNQTDDSVTVCAPMLEWGDVGSAWTESASNDLAGFAIDADAIHTSGMAITSNADDSIALSTINFTRNINEKNRSDLRFAIGSNFGVTGTGKIYASDVDLTGQITATSGQIGGFTISTTSNSTGGEGGHYYAQSLYVQTDDVSDDTKRYEAGICVTGNSTKPCFYVVENSKNGAWSSAANPDAIKWKWYVARNGYMFSTSGKIGGWMITDDSLYRGSNVIGTQGNSNIYLGDDGFSLGNKFVYKTNDGSLSLKVSSLSIAGTDISAETNVRNLVSCSNVNIYNSPTYKICDLQLVEGHGLQAGETVTIQIKGTLSEGKTGFSVCNSGGSVGLKTVNATADSYDSATGVYTATFNWKIVSGSTTANNTFISIYQMPTTVAHASSIEWVMLERGTVAHPHKLSDEDLNIMDEVIIGTQTSATAAWTGNSNYIRKLTNGVRIKYWLPVASDANATLELTVKDPLPNNPSHTSTTGAIPCYYGGTTRIGTQYPAGNMLSLVYRENVTIGTTTISKGWWADANYDKNDNTYDRTRYQVAVYANTSISKNGLIVGLKSSKKYQNLNKGTAFDITMPILWSAVDIAADANNTNTYIAIPCNLKTATNTSLPTLEIGKAVYIKGTLNGDVFTPQTANSANLTQAIPSSIDNFHYLYLGVAYSATNIYLEPTHPVYMYFKNKFMKIDEIAKTFMYFDSNNGLILSQNEITITNEDSTDNGSISKCGGNIRLTNTGMQVRSGKSTLAEYGNSITLNYATNGYKAITLDTDNGLQMFYNNSSHTLAAKLNTTGLIVSAGKIGGDNGWTIESQKLYSGTYGTENSMYLGTKDLGSKSISNITLSDWRLTIGANFGVTKNGSLYATSGRIGGLKISTYSIYTGDKLTYALHDDKTGFCLDTSGRISVRTSGGNVFKLSDEDGIQITTDQFNIITPITQLVDDDNKTITMSSSIPTNLIDWMKIITARTSMFHVHSQGIELADFNNTYSPPDQTFYHGPKNSYLFFHEIPSDTNSSWRTGGYISASKKVYDTLYCGLEFGARRPDTEHSGVTQDVTLAVLTGSDTSTELQLSGIQSANIYYTISDSNGGRKHLIGANRSGSNQYLTIGHDDITTLYLRANTCKLSSGSVITSDQSQKKDICDLDKLSHDFIMSLKPKKFKYINGKSNRYHTGFIAQQVEQAMNSTIGDFGVFCNVTTEENTTIASLRYDEFIAPHIAVTQEHEREIQSLKNEVADLKNHIRILLDKLGEK